MNFGWDLPPGCTQREIDEALEGRPSDEAGDDIWGDARRLRDKALDEALISIALSPYEVAALTMDGSEDLLERERRLS